MLKSFSILQHRHILLLWLGQLLSAFGDRFFEIAVIWLSVQIVGSEVGFVLAAGSVARLILGLLGGVYADRWDRQKMMIAVDISRAIAILSLPVATLLGEITLLHLTIVAILEGGLSSIFDPALQASLPHLVDNSQELQAGNALLDVTSRMARIFAPGLAGLLIAFIPLEQFFTLDAITFGISAVALVAIGRGFLWRPDAIQQKAIGVAGIWADIRGAMSLVHANKPVFWSLVSYIPANIVWAGVVMVGLALFADGELDVGVQGYSFLITAYGIGSVLSNLIVGSVRIHHRARFLFWGLSIFGLGLMLVGVSRSYTMAIVGMLVAATGTPMSDLMISLMIQTEFPANQVGKVYSLRLTISSVGYSLGLLIAAYLFQLISVPIGILLYGALAFVMGLVGVIRFQIPASNSKPIG